MTRRFSILLACLCMFVAYLQAVPATPYPVICEQPDGSELTIRLYGDEFSHIVYSEDGYTLLPNDAAFWCYATLDAAGELVPSDMIARPQQQRTTAEKSFLKQIRPDLQAEPIVQVSQKRKLAVESLPERRNYPVMGKQKSLVILVNFSDKSFVTANPQEAFFNLLNEPEYSENGATGSARDYFLSASSGQFSPDFVVVGPYTLPNEMSYYGGNSRGSDKNPAQMVVDACALANDDVDFTEYDTDGDGYIDNVFVYYAGYNEAEGAESNTVWPHRWVVYSGNSTGTRVFDGKILYDYACTSELKGTRGNNMCGIGTFCHEFGHVLGLPDFYHTTANKVTLEYWDVMDLGPYLNEGRTPPTYSTYERFFLGWLTPTELLQSYSAVLYPINQSKTTENESNQAYLIAQTAHNLNGSNPSPAEFFLLEYRKKTGWDAYLPGEGLLIWHIDYLLSSWENNTVNNYSGSTQTSASHMRVYLQPNTGLSTVSTGSAFTTGSFKPTLWNGTVLSTEWNDTIQNKDITSITVAEDKESLSFLFMGGSDLDLTAPVLVDTTGINMAGFSACWRDGRATVNEGTSISYLLTAYETANADSAFVYNKQEVSDTTFVLTNLKPDTEYAVYVQAVIRRNGYVWTTGRSNTLSVKTLADVNAKRLAVSVEITGAKSYNLVLVKEVSSEPLYVYDSTGRLIYTDRTQQNMITFSSEQFPRGTICIFKSGKRTAKWVF